jgi:hypothetical protein
MENEIIESYWKIFNFRYTSLNKSVCSQIYKCVNFHTQSVLTFLTGFLQEI